MIENIKPQQEWYNSNPEELLTYIAWTNSKVVTGEARKEETKRIAETLHKEFPCPYSLKAKWGLE